MSELLSNNPKDQKPSTSIPKGNTLKPFVVPRHPHNNGAHLGICISCLWFIASASMDGTMGTVNGNLGTWFMVPAFIDSIYHSIFSREQVGESGSPFGATCWPCLSFR